MGKNKKHILKELLSYGAIIGVSMFTFLVVLKVAYVDGNSMNDTYQNGDALLCLRLGTPEKGDVIVCDCDMGVTIVKRVIATAGDTVDIDFETGTVKVNDAVLNEPYIKEPTLTDEGAFTYPITVPDGCYFVMGDNRNNSYDSRDTRIGYIKEEQIHGKVLCEIPLF